MVDTVMVDAFSVHGSKELEMKGGEGEKKVKKQLKRKRASVLENVSLEGRESIIDALRRELDGLFRYFKEVSMQKVHLEDSSSCVSNSVIACLLEERDIPFSKLVEEIYEKLKTREGVTLASVRSMVLFVGQRVMYGVAKADADVLEDNTESCLWCWETRDMKIIPKTYRGILGIRRTFRKKIHERISAVSAMISAIQMPESHQNYRNELSKASDKLGKALNEGEIRSFVYNMVQKNNSDLAEKEAKLKEKELIKELERNKREAEKEKKRIDREIQKEKWQSEKELKRLQDEAEKEERRHEKEEAEMKKQLRRQQEEAEKDQRRQQRQEAELKKQLALQKQATIMERFLNSKKNTSPNQDQSSTKVIVSDSLSKRDEVMPNAVTLSMDHALSLHEKMNADDLRKLHLNSWHQFGHSIHSNRSQHWGIRHKPKTVLFKELKLTSSKGVVRGDDLSLEKLVDGWEETAPDDRPCQNNADASSSGIWKSRRSRQLLQFDKSYRPAFYGIWPRKSHVVGPRHPFKKDPNLDYEVDSDEEWEEEDPGESLSDCDKDDEEDCLEGTLKTDEEDGSEDGFLVPDGYLSENEGVQVDRMESNLVDDEARSPPSKHDAENEEFRELFRQQKYLNNLTEHALRKNQPLIISNLMHEKTSLLMAEDTSGALKLENMCLQALSIKAFPVVPPIEISCDNSTLNVDQEICHMQSNGSSAASADAADILEAELSKLVKKEVLGKLGLSISPEKSSGKRRGIASFFSKRCLPPASETINHETSPQPCNKTEVHPGQQGCKETIL
ncbi:PREDICTED: chromatin assembly factor 1 subunit FAS1 isoform X2 [Nelumbo nucifera]|uniref:Chromatin assembly factor 1 subunit FAS1 isoform X2 n=1 Tax=Nelumbo nucifera TaxID=4432 RepID=A0A1U7ZXG0_NELNU|nr:PREDICTED: chromatin assembly factor 1 subunit FAS1 isoform X2 [Nelumbo nucifera]